MPRRPRQETEQNFEVASRPPVPAQPVEVSNIPTGVEPATVADALQPAQGDNLIAAPDFVNVTDKLYHVGTLENCPLQNATIAGVCFPRWSEDVKFDPGTRQTVRNQRMGDYVRLTDEKIAMIKERVRTKVVRWISKDKKKGDLRSTETKGYRRMPDDEPLAKYVYLQEVPESALAHLGAGATLQ